MGLREKSKGLLLLHIPATLSPRRVY